jgi:hypothetical protein
MQTSERCTEDAKNALAEHAATCLQQSKGPTFQPQHHVLLEQ